VLLCVQVADKIDAQESCAAGNQIFCHRVRPERKIFPLLNRRFPK
jgi:hypothetical protein